jgi:hypothetical protein
MIFALSTFVGPHFSAKEKDGNHQQQLRQTIKNILKASSSYSAVLCTSSHISMASLETSHALDFQLSTQRSKVKVNQIPRPPVRLHFAKVLSNLTTPRVKDIAVDPIEDSPAGMGIGEEFMDVGVSRRPQG